MKLDVAIYGSYLELLLTVSNPASDAAENPTAASASFYTLVAGVLTASPLGTVALAQQDTIDGIWGASIDVSGVTVADLIVIVTAAVGGVNRSAVKLLGDSGIIVCASTTVGPPIITATAGPIVDDSKGPVA